MYKALDSGKFAFVCRTVFECVEVNVKCYKTPSHYLVSLRSLYALHAHKENEIKNTQLFHLFRIVFYYEDNYFFDTGKFEKKIKISCA